MGLYFVGNGLREALDPRLNRLDQPPRIVSRGAFDKLGGQRNDRRERWHRHLPGLTNRASHHWCSRSSNSAVSNVSWTKDRPDRQRLLEEFATL